MGVKVARNIRERTWTEGVLEQGAKENIWTKAGAINRSFEKNSHLGDS
jgi:hypothetical protein